MIGPTHPCALARRRAFLKPAAPGASRSLGRLCFHSAWQSKLQISAKLSPMDIFTDTLQHFEEERSQHSAVKTEKLFPQPAKRAQEMLNGQCDKLKFAIRWMFPSHRVLEPLREEADEKEQ